MFPPRVTVTSDGTVRWICRCPHPYGQRYLGAASDLGAAMVEYAQHVLDHPVIVEKATGSPVLPGRHMKNLDPVS